MARRQLGQKRLVASNSLKTSDGVTIHRVGFDNEHLRLEGQGRWTGDPRSRTSVRLQLRSANFGAENDVYCQCHQSIYDPFSIVKKSFVALPRPEKEG